MSDLLSAQTIQEGSVSINVPSEHQYKSDIASEVSYYQYRKLYPYTEPVAALNGTTISEFEITPTQVFNLSKSFLEADIVLTTAGANLRAVLHSGFAAMIDQIEFLDASGRQLVYLQNIPYMTKIVWPASTQMSDFLSNPVPPDGTTVAAGGKASAIAAAANPPANANGPAGCKTTLLNRSNVKIPDVDAIGGTTVYNSSVLITNGADVDPNLECKATSMESFTGVSHGITSGANANLAVRLQVPLCQFYGSLFSCNKDLYFGQTTIIRITWNQSAKWGFVASTNTVGAVSSALTGTTAPTLSSVRIRLAQQANPIAAESIKKKVNTEGLHLNVPFTWSFKFVPTGAGAGVSQSLVRKINKSHGQRLLRVWTSQYNYNGDGGGAYYCQNQNFADAMFNEVWAQLDGVNLQENNLINQNGEVYEFLQQKIDGSAGASISQYLSSAYMLNDFTPWKTVDFAKADTEVCGVSLAEEREYAINFKCNNFGGGNTNLFYMFVVCQRLLSITREGVMFA
jgi:hypothetical protein